MHSELKVTVHPAKLLLQSLILAALVLHAFFQTACSPITQVKRSALTLGPQPVSSSGRSVGSGHVRLYGGMSTMEVDGGVVTHVGDAGLWVPEQQLLGGLRLGLSDHVDIGFKGLWTEDDWSEASTLGVAPLGRKERDAWGMGPTLTVSAPLGRSGLALGFVFEALWASVPYAIWQLKDDSTSEHDFERRPYDPHQPWEAQYQFIEEGREHYLLYNLALLLNYRFDGAPIQLFGGAGMHSTLRNIGFDDEVSYESTLEKGDPVPLMTMGMEALLADHLALVLQGYLPLNDESDSAHAFGPGLELALGLQF